MASSTVSWKAPADEALSWFKPGAELPSRPKPLEYTVAVYAFAFGVSRALESLYFPLYEVRTRLIDGELYLAAVPSAIAERELEAHLGRMRDSGLRFTRSVRGGWERLIRREVEEYNERMAGFAADEVSEPDVAAGLTALRRTRANQWFAATRAVFAPTVMLEHGIGDSSAVEARAVSREALEAIRGRGGQLLDSALLRVGNRLLRRGCVEQADDIWWLDLAETREALTSGRDYRPLVTERRARAAGQTAAGPAALGPTLPADAPRMYLLRDVLALIATPI